MLRNEIDLPVWEACILGGLCDSELATFCEGSTPSPGGVRLESPGGPCIQAGTPPYGGERDQLLC